MFSTLHAVLGALLIAQSRSAWNSSVICIRQYSSSSNYIVGNWNQSHHNPVSPSWTKQGQPELLLAIDSQNSKWKITNTSGNLVVLSYSQITNDPIADFTSAGNAVEVQTSTGLALVQVGNVPLMEEGECFIPNAVCVSYRVGSNAHINGCYRMARVFFDQGIPTYARVPQYNNTGIYLAQTRINPFTSLWMFQAIPNDHRLWAYMTSFGTNPLEKTLIQGNFQVYNNGWEVDTQTRMEDGSKLCLSGMTTRAFFNGEYWFDMSHVNSRWGRSTFFIFISAQNNSQWALGQLVPNTNDSYIPHHLWQRGVASYRPAFDMMSLGPISNPGMTLVNGSCSYVDSFHVCIETFGSGMYVRTNQLSEGYFVWASTGSSKKYIFFEWAHHTWGIGSVVGGVQEIRWKQSTTMSYDPYKSLQHQHGVWEKLNGVSYMLGTPHAMFGITSCPTPDPTRFPTNNPSTTPSRSPTSPSVAPTTPHPSHTPTLSPTFLPYTMTIHMVCISGMSQAEINGEYHYIPRQIFEIWGSDTLNNSLFAIALNRRESPYAWSILDDARREVAHILSSPTNSTPDLIRDAKGQGVWAGNAKVTSAVVTPGSCAAPRILAADPTVFEVLAEEFQPEFISVVGVILAVTLVMCLGGSFYAGFCAHDNFRTSNVLIFGFYMIDFISDVLFVALLALRNEYRLAAIAATFIFLPMAINLIYLQYKLVQWRAETSNASHLRDWLRQYNCFLLILTVMSGSAHPALQLVNSNLCGAPPFQMGMSFLTLKRVKLVRFWTTTLLENAPQLALQVYFVLTRKEYTLLIILAFVSSFFSILLSALTLCSLRNLLSDITESTFVIHIKASELNDPRTAALFVNQHNPIKKATRAVLEVPLEKVEVVRVDNNIGEACVVFNVLCEKEYDSHVAFQKLRTAIESRDFERKLKVETNLAVGGDAAVQDVSILTVNSRGQVKSRGGSVFGEEGVRDVTDIARDNMRESQEGRPNYINPNAVTSGQTAGQETTRGRALRSIARMLPIPQPPPTKAPPPNLVRLPSESDMSSNALSPSSHRAAPPAPPRFS